MKYNIAFSSSGILMAVHVGVLAYLQDNKIKIKNYSGTSGGAIVACWGANNLPARELLKLTVQFGHPKFFVKFSFLPFGMFNHNMFGKSIGSYCKPKKNLWIITFNLLKMKKEIWHGETINLPEILNATTSVPGLFMPVLSSKGIHVDGILGSFCPDDLWEEGMTISVKLKKKANKQKRYFLNDLVHKFEETGIDVLNSLQGNRIKRKNVISLEPQLNSISQMDFFSVSPKDHLELFEQGYKEAKKLFL